MLPRAVEPRLVRGVNRGRVRDFPTPPLPDCPSGRRPDRTARLSAELGAEASPLPAVTRRLARSRWSRWCLVGRHTAPSKAYPRALSDFGVSKSSTYTSTLRSVAGRSGPARRPSAESPSPVRQQARCRSWCLSSHHGGLRRQWLVRPAATGRIMLSPSSGQLGEDPVGPPEPQDDVLPVSRLWSN